MSEAVYKGDDVNKPTQTPPKKKKVAVFMYIEIVRNATLRVFNIKNNRLTEVGFIFNKRYRDADQAVYDQLAAFYSRYKTFPKGFVVPEHAELTADRRFLKYSSGYTLNYAAYLGKEKKEIELIQICI